VSFLSTSSPHCPAVSKRSRRVKCLDVGPGELVQLREIADKQTSDRMAAAACGTCDFVNDFGGSCRSLSLYAQPVTQGRAITSFTSFMACDEAYCSLDDIDEAEVINY